MKADWLDPRSAAALILERSPLLAAEALPLREALGRVLAEDLVAPLDLPLWANSGMDGFAVHAADVLGATRAAPVVLPVIDDIAAGHFPRAPLPRGSAARIMTGAPLPHDADSVIRIEHTGGMERAAEGTQVRIFEALDAGRNLRRRGEDLRAGTVAIERGSVLTPAAMGVAACTGAERVQVLRRPRVALLTSGDELVELEEFDRVRAGEKIVSSNSIALAAQLEEIGCDVTYLGIAPDSREALAAAVRQTAGCDALITSGGISVGEHDHVKAVMLDLGARVHFWRVRMRPGSPFAFGTIDSLGGIPWFGLPGNPVSSMVTFELFARPALLRMSGHQRPFRATLNVRILDSFDTPPGLALFSRVELQQESDGEWSARLTGDQGSGVLSSMARADGLAVIPADRTRVESGDRLQVIPLGAASGLSVESPPY